MYGGNKLNTTLEGYGKLSLEQQTDYPWNGNINIVISEAPSKSFAMMLRIPGWCNKATVKVNGQLVKNITAGGYYESIKRVWKKGDRIELLLDMPVQLMESNPMVEETRNQVAIKKGPVVYCLEADDLETNVSVTDIVIPANMKFTAAPYQIDKGSVMALSGTAEKINQNNWSNGLYRPVQQKYSPVKIRLIPYYAWANRGDGDMQVWLPIAR